MAIISTVAQETVAKNDTNRGNHFHNPIKRKGQSVSLTAAACHGATSSGRQRAGRADASVPTPYPPTAAV